MTVEEINEKSIQSLLYYPLAANNIVFPNVHFFASESDLLQVTRAGYTHSYEIKITRGDYRADFDKPIHAYLEQRKPYFEYNKYSSCPKD